MQNRNIFFYGCLLLLPLICCRTLLSAQNNLVPNPGFEDVTDCNLDYGEADKAFPWKIINGPIATPDLFHTCSTNSFFLPPDGCVPVYPHSGEGMVGLVNMVPMSIEERIYARLLDDLPLNTDIYVAYSIFPRQKCGGEFEILCYSNTQSLAFSDVQFQSMQVVLQLDTILGKTEEWTLMQACFRANGSEKFVLLGNFRSALEIQQDCDYISSDFNFAYFYVDDVIVSPFDVVPDTLFICGDEVLNVDASFYDIPIQWSDGWRGGMRPIDQAGEYTVMGDIGDCFLTDETLVIKIPDETEVIAIDLCEGGQALLESPVPAVWENGDTSSTLLISRPGAYSANLLSTCGERWRTYMAEEKDCGIQYFVPTAFSPNGDGVNDRLQFFFKSEYEFTGELNIFDRWGNLIFGAKNVNPDNPVSWDGTYNGKPFNTGVFIWVFRYVSAKDGKGRPLSGNTVLVR
ncbi:MAG: gliding motility-associated C-terminal domain-containing protein [Lewinellaceae bacterium]|nr:gliding motility-associated C-terminal domain-containing protein [Phaeodactylibacter sp.]MCB0611942.1 gliding motility-associated C-terminal domain-containing protein [Phaeodactylibacter sp.]MCB9348332.1 gliding motility-associated C-terminal domain-containing protein [Lewinellaceae bacterium]